MIPFRLLLIDEHPVARRGLRALLSQLPDFEVVGEAQDGPSALAAAQHLSPDVVVTELSLRGMSGVQVITRLREIREDIPVLAFTSHDQPGFVRSALDAGARGYLLKSSSAAMLRHALLAVGRGETFIDATLTSQLQSPSGRRQSTQSVALSEREREVLVAVARGYSNKEIAGQIQLSVKTVETYRFRGTEKLGLRSRADLVRYAIDRGWLAPAGLPQPQPVVPITASM